jgi:hypothetical protein
MAVEPAIPFHMKVHVHTSDPAKREIDGRLGYVAGVTEHPCDDGRFGYGDLSIVWCCAESELEPTGELDQEQVRIAEEQQARLAAKWRAGESAP